MIIAEIILSLTVGAIGVVNTFFVMLIRELEIVEKEPYLIFQNLEV